MSPEEQLIGMTRERDALARALATLWEYVTDELDPEPSPIEAYLTDSDQQRWAITWVQRLLPSRDAEIRARRHDDDSDGA